jgi:hypothetical protein
MIHLSARKVVLIVAFAAFAALFGGIAVAQLVSAPQTAGDLDNTSTINQTEPSFYELAYAKATSEQKIELDNIVADKSIGLPGEWRRAVLIAIGDLPKDQPRLTTEQAGKLYDTKDRRALEREFNKIAGAPDFIGGSGIERSIYYLNDNRTEAIFVMLGDAFHYVFNDDGTYTTLPLGNQKLPVEQGPSISP